MKWFLIKKEKKIKIKKPELAINGLEIELKKQLIIIYPQDVIDRLLLKMIEEDLDKLIRKIINHLTNDEESADETALLLDELARQRSVYREYDHKLSKKAIMKYMKKIRFVAFELKQRLVSYTYEAPKQTKGRGR